MKKAVIIPDSFKGTVSSAEICGIISRKLTSYYPECEIISVPVADGGEGSVDALLQAAGGKKAICIVKNPYMEDLEAYYGILKDGKTAIIEMAACAGLPLVENRKNPCLTTTYGVGQLIETALNHGAEEIILALGGSATNDGGCGMAAALGIEFIDAEGASIVPTGGTLHLIREIRTENRNPKLDRVKLTVMCDVDNPLCGENGAAFVFGPQKGADPEMTERLDRGLAHLAHIVLEQLGVDILEMKGAGAAGGMGGGAVAFFGATLKSGIETILEAVEFDRLAAGADFIFTGEGRVDHQSLHGKVIDGVAAHAEKLGIPVIVFAGAVDDDIDEMYDRGVAAIFGTNRTAAAYPELKHRAKTDVALTVDTFLRVISLNKSYRR
jgi:glycerate kinase